MTEHTSFLMSPFAAPAWVFLGVLVTKGLDFLMARRKEGADEVAQVTTAHANLNKSLQASFEVMSSELTRLREDRTRDAQAWAAKEDTYTQRIQALEDELTRVQMILLEAGQGCPTCSGLPPLLEVEVK